NTRERSNVVVPPSENTPSSRSEERTRPPPSSIRRLTSRSKPLSGSFSRGSAGSVITAVLLVAKISSSCACAAGTATPSATTAARRALEMSMPRQTPARSREPPWPSLCRQAVHELDPRAHPELGVHPRERALDGLLAQEQFGRHLLVRPPLRHQAGHVAL